MVSIMFLAFALFCLGRGTESSLFYNNFLEAILAITAVETTILVNNPGIMLAPKANDSLQVKNRQTHLSDQNYIIPDVFAPSLSYKYSIVLT